MKKKSKKSQGGGQQFLSPEKYLQQKARTLAAALRMPPTGWPPKAIGA